MRLITETDLINRLTRMVRSREARGFHVTYIMLSPVEYEQLKDEDAISRDGHGVVLDELQRIIPFKIEE